LRAPQLLELLKKGEEGLAISTSAAPPVRGTAEAEPAKVGQRGALSSRAARLAARVTGANWAVLLGALPPALTVAPLAAGAVRALSARGGVWLWGDQAVIDLEARDSLLGRNLLGVYDRFGWHHLGPLWLLALGLVRWAGGGSPGALVIGSFLLQAAAAAGIVLVASRLREGRLTSWCAALAVVAYEWDFGPERFGTVWAPYAIALPAALLLLLTADVATNDNPWPAAFGELLCASFLVQTDVGTGVVVGGLVALAVVLRAVRSSRLPPMRSWRPRAALLAGVAIVAWLPPLVQQFTTEPGNMTQVARFFTTHSSHRSWHETLRALSTLFGTFPLQRGAHGANLDAKLTWLGSVPVRSRPWYLVYLLGMVVGGAFASVRRRQQAAALAAACLVSMLAAAWSVHVAYGDLYPYLVVWMGALAVPAWVAVALAFAPSIGAGARGLGRRVLPAVATAAAVAVTVGFAASPSPMTGTPSLLGRLSWKAVEAAVSSPQVRTVYVDIAANDAMPEAAAIADEVVRHGRRVEVNRQALYFFDPSFSPRAPAQVKIVVCCGRGDPGMPPPGALLRGRIGGQSIYLDRVNRWHELSDRHLRHSR